jgi:curved DNA-binding protein CbpA
MSAPTLAATGSLGATPVSQLLIYGLERSLTGSLVFQSGAGARSAITFAQGIVVKARVPSVETSLGQLCVRLGIVDASDIEQTVKQERSRLFGEHLYDLGLIEREQLSGVLVEQVYVQLEWLARLPAEAQYGFYDQQDLLANWGGRPLEIDPLAAIGRVTKAMPLSAQLTNRVVAGMGDTPLQLHPQARVGRFEFNASQTTVLDVLRAKPQSFGQLLATELMPRNELEQLVTLLALTKHLQIPGGLPLGVNVTHSASSVTMRRVLSRRAGNLTPSPSVREPDSSSVPPGSQERRAEIAQKAVAIESANFYQVLGVEPNADVSVIQNAFLQLAKRWHPDRVPSQVADLKPVVTRIFARMTEAHQILTNARNRAEYDKLSAGGGNSDDDQRKVQEVLRAASAFQKAEVLAKREDWAAAFKVAEQAYQGDPNQAEYGALYAWIAARATESPNYEELLQILTRAVKMQRNNVRVRLYRASVFKLAGQTQEAMRDYRVVSDLDPTNVEAQRELRLYRMRKETSPPPGVLSRIFKKP